MNFGNHITEIPTDRMGVKCSECPKGNQLWQFHYQNREKKIYGNAIAENGREKKKKKKVAEIWGGIKKKKKCYVHNIFTTFSQ